MTTRRTPRPIKASNRRRSAGTVAMSISPGGVKTAMSFHSFIRPWFPKKAHSMHSFPQPCGFSPFSAVDERPRKNSRDTNAMSSSSADSVIGQARPRPCRKCPTRPPPKQKAEDRASAARQRNAPVRSRASIVPSVYMKSMSPGANVNTPVLSTQNSSKAPITPDWHPVARPLPHEPRRHPVASTLA